MNNIGDIPRALVSEDQLIEFGKQIIEWLMTEEDGNPSDNIDYSYFCQKKNIFEDDIDYFINAHDSFYLIMKKAEEIKRTKIKNFAASGILNATIAKKLLSEKSKIIQHEKKGVPKSDKLTEKQIKFCREYIIDGNGTQAAIRAGYSKKTANVHSSKMLIKANIQNYISDLKSYDAKRNEITKDMIVSEMAKLGFSNIQDYISNDNEIIDISKIERDKAAAVRKIKTTKREIIIDGVHVADETKTEFELSEKQKSLEGLSKLLGFDSVKKIDVTTNGESLNVPILNVDPLKNETDDSDKEDIEA